MYTTLSEEINYSILLHLKAIAMSSLTLEILDRNPNLDRSKIYIYFDQIDSKGSSEKVGEWVNDILLDELGYKLPYYFKKQGEKNPVVKAADRIAYNLAGLRFRNPNGQWPYRNRKIDLEKRVKIYA